MGKTVTDVTLEVPSHPPVHTSVDEIEKVANQLKADPPKDRSVEQDHKRFQMPLFDGFEVEHLEAKIEAAEVALNEVNAYPKRHDQRVFLVYAKVNEVRVKDKKVRVNMFSEPEVKCTRTAIFEVEQAYELDQDRLDKLERLLAAK